MDTITTSVGYGVLEFIHQDVPETVLVMLAQGIVITQQLECSQQQLRKIDHAGALAGRFIGRVDTHKLRINRIMRGIDMRRALPLVLACIDEGLGLPWRPAGLVKLQRFQYAPDQPVLVVRIKDLECLRQTGFLPV